jgi:hypothetical protein
MRTFLDVFGLHLSPGAEAAVLAVMMIATAALTVSNVRRGRRVLAVVAGAGSLVWAISGLVGLVETTVEATIDNGVVDIYGPSPTGAPVDHVTYSHAPLPTYVAAVWALLVIAVAIIATAACFRQSVPPACVEIDAAETDLDNTAVLEGSNLLHIVGRWHGLLDDLGLRVPRALCGEKLVGTPSEDPDRWSPICPRCANRNGWWATRWQPGHELGAARRPT